MEVYPKFKEGKECAYPKRTNCNFSKNEDRCKYMKYDNSKSINDPNRWGCTFIKE